MKTEDILKRYSSKKGLKEDLKNMSVRKIKAIHGISIGTIQKLKKMNLE